MSGKKVRAGMKHGAAVRKPQRPRKVTVEDLIEKVG